MQDRFLCSVPVEIAYLRITAQYLEYQLQELFRQTWENRVISQSIHFDTVRSKTLNEVVSITDPIQDLDLANGLK